MTRPDASERERECIGCGPAIGALPGCPIHDRCIDCDTGHPHFCLKATGGGPDAQGDLSNRQRESDGVGGHVIRPDDPARQSDPHWVQQPHKWGKPTPERERVPTVEELRRVAHEMACCGIDMLDPGSPLLVADLTQRHLCVSLHAALARVAELEAAVATEREGKYDYQCSNLENLAELSRLREGLREIEEAETDWHVGIAENIERLQSIARRLLGEGE